MQEFIGSSSQTVNNGIPVWQTIREVAQGGFTLDRDNNVTAGKTIPAGTPVTYNEATRLAFADNSVINTNVKGLLQFDVVMPDTDEPEASISVVLEGVIYERRILDTEGDVATIASNIKTALPNIIFSQSR
jgi:hypothetical protein